MPKLITTLIDFRLKKNKLTWYKFFITAKIKKLISN